MVSVEDRSGGGWGGVRGRADNLSWGFEEKDARERLAKYPALWHAMCW